MGGLVNDAFVITTVTDGGQFLFLPILKDRKSVIDKIRWAISNKKEAEGVDATLVPDSVRTKLRMPPDPTVQNMEVIAEKKIKGVSLQEYCKVAVRAFIWFAVNIVLFIFYCIAGEFSLYLLPV